MNTVLVLLVILVYLIQSQATASSGLSLASNVQHNINIEEGIRYGVQIQNLCGSGSPIGSLALVGCGQDEKDPNHIKSA